MSCQAIQDKHKSVFDKGLGTIKRVTAKFYINPDVQPRFYKQELYRMLYSPR